MNIPRVPGDPNEAEGPCWWMTEGSLRVFAKCENGHIGRLEDHSIGDSGRVQPSIECKTCGWHVMGILEDWPR